MTDNYIPPFIIGIHDTKIPHDNKWPDISPDLAKDLLEVYKVDPDLLSQAINLHNPTVRHFSVTIGRIVTAHDVTDEYTFSTDKFVGSNLK